MPEETQELRRINWTECFGFTHIFRTFRFAIHPSKMVLAVAGLVLTVFVGTVMDGIWCAAGQSAVPGEIQAYIQGRSGASWRAAQLAAGREILRRILAEGAVVQREKEAGDELEKEEDYWKAAAEMPERIREHYDKSLQEIRKARKPEDLQKLCLQWAGPGRVAVPPAIAQDADKLREHALQLARNAHKTALAHVESLQRRGIFCSLLTYERGAIRQAVEAARALNFNGAMDDVVGDCRLAAAALENPSGTGPGLVPSLLLMVYGLRWVFAAHWLFAVIFLLLVLAIWSFFGGAICRIAAMHMARDEKISIKQAASFARRKFIGFFAAPLIPLGLIICIGILLALGGLIGSIPFIGEILTGAFFFLALIAGFVMALVLIGGVAGGSLMWPTIAVEGSDSFDAISRSFSYIYSRPWRSLLYFLVACVYGAFCFLFIRVFALIMLKLTHFFVGAGMMFAARPAAGEEMNKLDVMWTSPSFTGLMPAWAFLGREHWDVVGGVLIWIWVALTVATVYAFLISFYYSGSTVLYYLLRREVDATDLEDVYLEETEEETAPPATGTAEAPAKGQPAAETPPPPPPAAASPPAAPGGSGEAGGSSAPGPEADRPPGA